jgi:hypothetical protein
MNMSAWKPRDQHVASGRSPASQHDSHSVSEASLSLPALHVTTVWACSQRPHEPPQLSSPLVNRRLRRCTRLPPCGGGTWSGVAVLVVELRVRSYGGALSLAAGSPSGSCGLRWKRYVCVPACPLQDCQRPQRRSGETSKRFSHRCEKVWHRCESVRDGSSSANRRTYRTPLVRRAQVVLESVQDGIVCRSNTSGAPRT